MSAIDTAEFRKLTLLAAGIDPTEIPPILDTAEWRRLLIVAIEQATAGGGGGGGTVTSVTGTSPIASSGGATPAISITDAAADGTTKGAAAFNASDFNATSGVVSIDYTNGQAASTSAKGFLTSTDWNTFNSKQVTITTGAVDNAILRADGTGGRTLQNSGLIVEDTIESFAVTGVASTDIITATGSAFANSQPVRFTALTGGSGLVTTTNYYVINVSGTSFQVSTSVGGGASLFTTDITAGTLLTGHSVSTNVTLSENTTATNSDLVLTPKGTGAFILGPKPDGTVVGGNARGARAIDIGASRTSAGQVASGSEAVSVSANRPTASGANSGVFAGALLTASGTYSVCSGGSENTANTSYAGSFGGFQSLANRYGMRAHASGSFSNAPGSGDAQRARFVLRCKTTTNTAVEMALDGGSIYLAIPSGKYLTGTINIAGIKSDASATASYIRQFSIKNVAATTTLVGTVNTIGIDTESLTSISITANDASDYLSVKVTGILSETWRWVASVDVVEVAYGT